MIDLDPRYGNNFIDANVLDRTYGPEDTAVDEILELADSLAFSLLLPFSVKKEIDHPHTPMAVKRRAVRLNYSIEVKLTAPELAKREIIRILIQGNAKPDKHDMDALHLVESAKYGGRHFITSDDRLLRMAPAIWQALSIKVLKPSDFLAAYWGHRDD